MIVNCSNVSYFSFPLTVSPSCLWEKDGVHSGLPLIAGLKKQNDQTNKKKFCSNPDSYIPFLVQNNNASTNHAREKVWLVLILDGSLSSSPHIWLSFFGFSLSTPAVFLLFLQTTYKDGPLLLTLTGLLHLDCSCHIYSLYIPRRRISPAHVVFEVLFLPAHICSWFFLLWCLR